MCCERATLIWSDRMVGVDGGQESHPDEVAPKRGAETKPGFGSVRPTGTGNVTVTRAIVVRGRYFSKLVVHQVIKASESDGAKESGLTAMIWNQVMSYGSDAMITVALAGTVFFSASGDAQRANVLLYLATTVAPFAILAPVIGPAWDRLRRGRRWVLAGTAIGRAALAVVMALNFTNLFVLFPSALGSLVLSKAYAIIRAAAAPRLVPTGMTLVAANARLSLFGLVAAVTGGGFVGVAIKITGSYPLGLWITAAAFAATAGYAIRLPAIVDQPPADDAPAPAPDPPEPRSRPMARSATAVQPSRKRRIFALAANRIRDWASRGFGPHAVLAVQGEILMRWLSGFLTLYLAFHIEATSHGVGAAARLGALGAATGLGNFAGTAIGVRMKLSRPDVTVIACAALSALLCVVGAVFFSIGVAVVLVLFAAAGNSLAKLSLDAIVQRDVAESLRSSAFARSETFLQLGWVVGAAIALLLPAHNGRIGFIVAAAVTAGITFGLLLRRRALDAGPVSSGAGRSGAAGHG